MSRYHLDLDSKHEEIVAGLPVSLFRIVSDREFRDGRGWKVLPGDKGGWVEERRNLDQEGDCWIGPDAIVCGTVRVTDDSYVGGRCRIRADGVIGGFTRIEGKVFIEGPVQIRDSRINDQAVISALPEGRITMIECDVREFAEIHGSGRFTSCWILDNTDIRGGAMDFHKCKFTGKASVHEVKRLAFARIKHSHIKGDEDVLVFRLPFLVFPGAGTFEVNLTYTVPDDRWQLSYDPKYSFIRNLYQEESNGYTTEELLRRFYTMPSENDVRPGDQEEVDFCFDYITNIVKLVESYRKLLGERKKGRPK